jgi:DNA-binding MarR family transcriptional regulator
MTLDASSLLALTHRLADVDHWARARIARLLVIGDIEARVVLLLAARGHLTLADLQAELGLSRGGAVVLAGRLDREALVRREPDPRDPSAARMRLSPGAASELNAALSPVTERLSAIGNDLRDLSNALEPLDRGRVEQPAGPIFNRRC